jgi:chromate reductase
MNSILAITGSLRRHSYNRMLLRAVVDLAPAGLSVRLWDDLPTIPLFGEDLEAEPARIENVRKFAAQVSSADGVLHSEARI